MSSVHGVGCLRWEAITLPAHAQSKSAELPVLLGYTPFPMPLVVACSASISKSPVEKYLVRSGAYVVYYSFYRLLKGACKWCANLLGAFTYRLPIASPDIVGSFHLHPYRPSALWFIRPHICTTYNGLISSSITRLRITTSSTQIERACSTSPPCTSFVPPRVYLGAEHPLQYPFR